MRLNLAVLGLSLALATGAVAQDAPIQDTIRKQLDAFAADDFAAAWTYASPTIHGIFGTVPNFEAMMKQGYPMVWQPGAVRMLGQQDQPGMVLQRVLVTDLQGRGFLLDYMMVETPNGWQINAVQLLPAQGLGA